MSDQRIHARTGEGAVVSPCDGYPQASPPGGATCPQRTAARSTVTRDSPPIWGPAFGFGRETGGRTPGSRSDAVMSTACSRQWDVGSECGRGLRIETVGLRSFAVEARSGCPSRNPLDPFFGTTGADVWRATRYLEERPTARKAGNTGAQRARADGDQGHRKVAARTGGWRNAGSGVTRRLTTTSGIGSMHTRVRMLS